MARYKVMADYPYSQFEVRTTLEVDKDGELYSKQFGYVQSKYIVKESDAIKHPHLFRLMAWWEELTAEEMPEYIKHLNGSAVLKIKEWDGNVNYNNVPLLMLSTSTIPMDYVCAVNYTPATLEEYEAYLKTKG